MKKILLLAILSFGLNTGVFADNINDYFADRIAGYQKVCELNEGASCYRLGLMYKQGWGVERNDVKAVEYFQKACELNDATGCSLLGLMYINKARALSKIMT